MKPGYKQTEVGVIPEDWDASVIDRAFQFKQGVQTPIEDQSITQAAGSTRFIRIIDLTNPHEEWRYIEDPGANHHVAPDDLFMVRYGSPGLIGFGYEGVIANNLFRLIPKRRVETPFYYHYLANRQADIAALSGSSTMPAVSFSTLRSLYIICPPLPEQRAIASALSDVDGLLGALDRLIAKKRDLKQAAMQQLLTGQTRLPGFHGKWVTKTFGELFNFSGGHSASRDQLSASGHCYLHYGDIHGSTKTFIDVTTDFQSIPKLDVPLKKVASRSLLEDGDVVFVDASEDDDGTSRHLVVVNKEKMPFISGLHTIVAKSKTDELANEYRRYCFQTAEIRDQFLFYAVGTKVSGISKSNIPKLKLRFPQRPEQIAIASVLSDMDAELAALEERQEKTRALKQGMMQELLTGRIRLV